MSESDESTNGGVSVTDASVKQLGYQLLSRALSNGQFIPILLGILLIILAIRLPPDDLSQGIVWFFTSLADLSITGWVLWALTIIGWRVHTQWLDLNTKEENQRLGKKKTELLAENKECAKDVSRLKEQIRQMQQGKDTNRGEGS